MDLSPQRFADTVVVSPAGRVDQSNMEAFGAALAPVLGACAPGKDRVVLDLSRLEFISSAGLRILMLAAKQTKAQQGCLIVSGLQPLVQEIFQISRFTMIFDIVPTLRDALAKASPAALAALDKA
ncbi:MAG TPA: STAS domain-containing protein [Terriglobales bacterium]|nr:STAS domain-containing protein [Terriglobales bacterium]